jgi:phospholipid/cholesterol/gamma-HCH transport system substrate-binding protein
MQRYAKLEISVGLFLLGGLAAVAYLSLTLGGVAWNEPRYVISARFSSVGDLKTGDAVKLAGVSVGEVTRISLVEYAAETELSLQQAIELPDDTIASIQTAGLLGDAYVSLSPGASERTLSAGQRIARTEPAINISELLGKYAFGSLDSKAAPPAAEEGSGALDLENGLP